MKREEGVLPARRVNSTDNESIGSALLSNLEQYMFGRTFGEQSTHVFALFDHTLIVIVCDSASSNLLFIRKLSSYLEHLTRCDPKLFLSLYLSRCGIHRASRIIVQCATRNKTDGALYAICRATRMRKTRWQIVSRIRVACRNIERVTIAPPEDASGRTAALVAVFKQMMSISWKVAGDVAVGSAACPFGAENLDLELEAFIRFFVDGVLPPWIPQRQGRTGRHRCMGFNCNNCIPAMGEGELDNLPSCPIDTEAFVEVAVATFSEMMYGRSVESYQTGRWTKLMPFLKKFCALLLSSDIAVYSLCDLHVNKDNAMLKQFGIRLTRLSRLLKREEAKFLFARTPSACNYADFIMQIFFAEGAMKTGKASQQPVYANAAAGLDGVPVHDHASRSGTWRITFRVLSVLAAVWEDLRSDRPSFLAVAGMFHPHGPDSVGAHKAKFTDALAICAEIKIRFLRDMAQAPWALASLEGKPADEWHATSQRLVRANDCDLLPVARGWKHALLKLPDDVSRGIKLRALYHWWDHVTRHDSRLEEDCHRIQREEAAGDKAAPRSFHFQAQLSSLRGIARIWDARGGRDLTKPLRALVRVYKAATDRIIHRRPKQLGSLVFFFIMKSMSPAQRALSMAQQKPIRQNLALTWKRICRTDPAQVTMWTARLVTR